MAPIRKFSNLNKLSLKDNKESPTKDASPQQKRKTSDLLGPQWSKEELGRFYGAYRKYGKSWKQVASVVRGRSVEMMEALYETNRPYLSLPEGTATVDGLISMMADHYSALGSDESGRESNEEAKIPRKIIKRHCGKIRGKMSKSTIKHVPHKLQSQAVVSNDGCLSLLKSNVPRIVGKRTPRIPISHPLNSDKERHLSPSKHDPSSEEDVNADETAEGASDLPKVLRGETSSHTPNRRTKPTMMSSVRGSGKIYAEAHTFRDKHKHKHIGAAKEDYGKGKLGMRETGSAYLTKDGVNKVQVCGKRKKFHKNKTTPQDNRYHSSGREPCRIKKKSKHLLSEDEVTAMDVLSILRDVSSKLEPTSTTESGSKENGDSHAMAGEDSAPDVGLTPEAKQEMDESTSIMNRRRRKTLSSKISKAEPQMNSLHNKQKRNEIPKPDSLVNCRLSEQQMTEDLTKSKDNPKPTTQISVLKQRKPVRPQESASKSDGFSRQQNLPSQVPIVDQVESQTKRRCRKMLPQKKMIPNRKSSENIRNRPSKDFSSSLHYRAHRLKEELSNCLSSGTLLRWCAFEWFYSAIDYPWFAKREFVEYLNHVGLGHVPKLTRVEWGVIKSSLGKPRRLSREFLKEEKDKLERYRESVRNHYAELRSGTTEAIPSDLARPLRVGQRVFARHPKTRGIYDGSILTVECNKCRVQFDRLELGVELVMDIDCMPMNMAENIPEALLKERFPTHKVQKKFNESINPKPVGQENLEIIDGSHSPLTTPSTSDTTTQEIITPRPSYSSDTDIRALADLQCVLKKKEMLVSELKYMNCEVLRNQNDGEEDSLKTSEHFKRQYATVLVQLKGVNDQVSSALLNMKQRNTFQENFSRSRSSSPTEPCNDFATLSQEPGSNVVDVIESSRWKAQKMVDVAAEVVSCSRQGEDIYRKIGEALDYNPNSEDIGEGLSPPPKSEIPIPSTLISSCVATLLMIQKCTDRQCPPGEAVEILDSALMSLQPSCSQNLPIYRDIQMCMGMVKNQILALIPT